MAHAAGQRAHPNHLPAALAVSSVSSLAHAGSHPALSPTQLLLFIDVSGWPRKGIWHLISSRSPPGVATSCLHSTALPDIIIPNFKKNIQPCSLAQTPCVNPNPYTNWTSGNPCDGNWTGIYCTNSVVTAIEVFGHCLSGTLPDSLTQLSGLQVSLTHYAPQNAVWALAVPPPGGMG